MERIPKELFNKLKGSQDENNQYMMANPVATLGLKTDYNYLYQPTTESCVIIPCGHLHYLE